MDIFNNLNISEPLLIVCVEEEKHKYTEEVSKFTSAQISTLQLLQDIKTNTIANAMVFLGPEALTAQALSTLLKILKPEGQLIIANLTDASSTEFLLKTNGFMNVSVTESCISAIKPKFAVGSAAKLNLKKPSLPVTVWKLDDDDDGDDLIDQDELLDEDDFKKPDPTSLRVCGTTGQRKACKDCSCGLAEELAVEARSGKVVDTKDAPKSSCGSCYLGDAFRCASCPYLGMPAFKPGEKIQLTTVQLKSDI